MQAAEERGEQGAAGVLDWPAIEASLAQGVTVVTPNRRLARALKQRFDQAQQRAGRTVWPAADVLPWPAWLIRQAEALERPPIVLSALQQQALWEQLLGRTPVVRDLPQLRQLAASADEAWTLWHEHGAGADYRHAAVNDEQQAFVRWAREFRSILSGRLTAAELPLHLARTLAQGDWSAPARLIFAGFDRLTAAQQVLIEALQAGGCAVESAWTAAGDGAAPVRVESPDLRAQWQQVAAWALARLRSNPGARIGIVVPDLGAHRAAIVDALTDALAPALRVRPNDDTVRPFNLSLGRPLADEPLVATALTVFDLAVGDIDIHAVGHLLRSPFLAGGASGEAEWGARARLDRALREQGHWQLDLDELRRAAGRLDAEGQPQRDAAPLLAEGLTRIARRLGEARSRRLPLSAWVAVLFGLLQDLGFPGTRGLDSVEYQAHLRWREVLTSLGTLDAVAGPVTLAAAIARLKQVAGDTLFQAETPPVPVQVIGALESQHLDFDHLWIANLSDDRWPPEPSPNPLLPLALQRAWQVPAASAALALAGAERLLAGWRHAAPELVLSNAQLDGDRPALPSALIAAVPVQRFEELAPACAPVTTRLARAVTLQALEDTRAPALDAEQADRLSGGTRVFTDQSACAFRAYATHRLRAAPLEAPAPGLDPAARGGLLHKTLENFWDGLPSQAALLALDDPACAARVRRCAQAALDDLDEQLPAPLPPRLRELESQRLQRATHAWLDVERGRPPFTVVDVESQREARIGGLRVKVRPDRVDRLADGSLAIIDYKTGRVSASAWLDARPDEPQLPLYATAFASGAMGDGPQRVGAIVFAQLRPGETKAVAVGAADGLVPAARVIGPDDAPITRTGWDGLMVDWREQLEALAAQFIGGEAAVAPKSTTRSCQYCELPLLCRLRERAAPTVEGEAEAGDE